VARRRLLLIRHAKSSWAQPELDDLLRPLNKRGYQACASVSQHPIIQQHLPDLVLCSPAVRAFTTAQALLQSLAVATDRIRLEEALYLASPAQLEAQLGKLQADTVWLVGHNPGIELLAQCMSQQISAFPTLAVAAFELPSAGLYGAQLIDFIVPKELTKQ